MPQDKSHFQYVLWSLFVLSLLGCSPEIAQSNLPVEASEGFSQTGEIEMPQKWWTSFNNPELDSLVAEALDSNFNIRAAWERFHAARAVQDRESSYLLPDIEAFAQTGTSYPRPDFAGGENTRLGARATYEIDLWGRIRSSIEAERYRAEANFTDYKAGAISLSAEITRTYFQLATAQQLLKLSEEQLKTNEQGLSLIKTRFGNGVIRGVDLLRQKQLVEATREQQIITESRIEVLKHQLMILKGAAPFAELDYQTDSLPTLPDLPETGVPLELVRRRPDVLSAFYVLQAADREVAAAISAKYPRISLNTNVAARSNNTDDLFKNWAYSIGANLVAPLFYGGRIRAEIDRTESVKQQRLYEYAQTVLIAFREVEDALLQEQKQKERIEVIKSQHTLAQKAEKQLQVEYLNGIGNYLDVLAATRQAQQLERDLINAQYSLLDFRISLYRALAGGFETKREETEN